MNSIKWIDAENGLVCMEAGIVGQDVKRRLEVYRMPRVPAFLVRAASRVAMPSTSYMA